MILQGFIYVEQTIDSMVSFLEERVEHWEPTHPEEAKKPKANKKRKAHFSTGSSGTSEEEEKEEEEPSRKRNFCQLYGMCNHTTDQCKGLKDLIKNKKYKKQDYKKKYSKSYNRQEIMHAMIQKGIKKGLRKAKKAKKYQELQQFQDLPVSSDDSSRSSSSSDSEWKTGSNEIFITDFTSNKKIKLHNTVITCLDSCTNANFNYQSISSRFASQSLTNKNLEKPTQVDLVPITFGNILDNTSETQDDNINIKKKNNNNNKNNKNKTIIKHMLKYC